MRKITGGSKIVHCLPGFPDCLGALLSNLGVVRRHDAAESIAGSVELGNRGGGGQSPDKKMHIVGGKKQKKVLPKSSYPSQT